MPSCYLPFTYLCWFPGPQRKMLKNLRSVCGMIPPCSCYLTINVAPLVEVPKASGNTSDAPSASTFYSERFGSMSPTIGFFITGNIVLLWVT